MDEIDRFEPVAEPIACDAKGTELKVGQRCTYGGIDSQLCEVTGIEWDDEGCTVDIVHAESDHETMVSSCFTRTYGDPAVEFGDLEVLPGLEQADPTAPEGSGTP